MIRYLLTTSMFLINVLSVMAQTVTYSVDSLNVYNIEEVVVIGEKPQIKGNNGVITADLSTLIKGKPVSNIYESLTYLPGITKDISGNLSLAGTNGRTDFQ